MAYLIDFLGTGIWPNYHMGRSQNYGPLVVMSYIAVPDIQGYQNGTLILGTTHISIRGGGADNNSKVTAVVA